jgi:hypothetical protein
MPRRLAKWGTRLVIALLLGGSLFVGSARSAGATATGTGTLAGTGVQTTFPCINAGTGGCPGTFTGAAGLSLSGVGMGVINGLPAPYAAVWTPALGNFSLPFSGLDNCNVPNGVPPILSTLSGTFALSGGTLVYSGGVLAGATLTGNATLTRAGAGVAVVLGNLSITSGLGTFTVNLSGQIVGAGSAGFAFTSVPGTCPGTPAVTQGFALAGIALQPA